MSGWRPGGRCSAGSAGGAGGRGREGGGGGEEQEHALITSDKVEEHSTTDNGFCLHQKQKEIIAKYVRMYIRISTQIGLNHPKSLPTHT